MAQYLSRIGKLNASRRDQFPSDYTQNLQKLVGDVAVEICEKHIKVCAAHFLIVTNEQQSHSPLILMSPPPLSLHLPSLSISPPSPSPFPLPSHQDKGYSCDLNTSLAFFIHDAFSLMDRGVVFGLIKTYLKKVLCKDGFR